MLWAPWLLYMASLALRNLGVQLIGSSADKGRLTPRWLTGEALPCQAVPGCNLLLTFSMMPSKGLLKCSHEYACNDL
jgi:hypothetical protein